MSTSETPLDTLKRLLTNRSPNTVLGTHRYLDIVSVFSIPAQPPPFPQVLTVSKPPDPQFKSLHSSSMSVVIIDDDEQYTVPSKRHQLPAFLPKTAKKTCLEPRR